MSEKSPGVASGALWSAGNNIVMRIAAIAVTAVVARLLSPEDFGVFALASAVFVVVTSLAELGLGSAITRSAEDPDRIAPTVTTLALTLSTVLAVGMALGASTLARLVGSAQAADPIRVLSICLFLSGVFAVPGAQMAREFRQRRLFVANVAGFVPANIVLVLLAAHGSGAMAFAWSRVVGQVLTGLVVLASVRTRYRPGLVTRLLRPLLTFGLPLALANLVNWTLLNADYVIIGHALDARDVGVYMAAFTVAGWSTAVMGSALNSVVVPALARVPDDPAARGRAVVSALRIVALVALPIGAVTVSLAHPVVLALYGAPFATAAPVLRVLAGYGVLYCVTLLLVNVLVASGRTGRLLLVQLAWLACLAPAMTTAVRWGLVGVAWVHIVVISLVVIPGYLVALRGVLRGNGGPVMEVLRRPLLGAVAAGLTAWGGAWLVGVAFGGPALTTVVVGGLAGGVVYLVVVAPAVVEAVGRERLTRWTRPTALAAQRRAAALPEPVRRLAARTVSRLRVRLPRPPAAALPGWDEPLVVGRGLPGGLSRLGVLAAPDAEERRVAEPPTDAPLVLVATGSLDAGGMDAFADFLARGLRGHGFSTEVLVVADSLSTADGRLAAELRRDGFTVHRADEETVVEILAQVSADVVSIHGVPDWAVTELAGRLSAPMVETLHGLHLFEGTDADQVAARSRTMTAVVSVSEMVRRQYLAAAPSVAPDDVVTIPNGVKSQLLGDDVRDAARVALGLSPQDVLFVSLARHCLQKNTYGLVRAFGDVAGLDERTHLLVAGRNDDDAYLDQVLRLRDSLPGRDRIHLRDHHPQPAVLLAAADVFVLDSYFEGWALSSMEALTAGVPVVLSEVAGAAEQLAGPDAPGRLVANPLGDPLAPTWPSMAASRFASQANRHELAAAMLGMAEDVEGWRGRRHRTADESARRFDPDLCLARHAEVLHRAVVHHSKHPVASSA